ncbi:RWD domain-containing protein 4 isoform X2 [Lycorma delicatula]|uniref:RWD domain-containing protein 4 isoform X2 n=1 Tax=Lycorma delicatula TaxID=130591 RepID=UPI003F512237
MSNSRELQEEEREVLLSIYDGDPAFKQLSPSTYQYKYGEDGDSKSFLLEISWSENYPAEKPIVNMDAFYNKHIIQSVKAHIKECILKEADDYLGAAMTFSLFESVKEKLSDLICEQPEEETAATQIQELTIQWAKQKLTTKQRWLKVLKDLYKHEITVPNLCCHFW